MIARVRSTNMHASGGILRMASLLVAVVLGLATGCGSDESGSTHRESDSGVGGRGGKGGTQADAATDASGGSPSGGGGSGGNGGTATGGIAGTGATGSGLPGPLAQSKNPNYFQDASGHALVLAGSHTWNNLQDWG